MKYLTVSGIRLQIAYDIGEMLSFVISKFGYLERKLKPSEGKVIEAESGVSKIINKLQIYKMKYLHF